MAAAFSSRSTSPTEAAKVKDRVEDYILGIEKVITQHNGEQLAQWCREQHRDILRSAKIDTKTLGLQEDEVARVAAETRDVVAEQRTERNEASAAAARDRTERDRDFTDELRAVGEVHAEATSRMIREYTAKVRQQGAKWDEKAWLILDKKLGDVTFETAQMVHKENPTAGVADVYASGALHEYLAAEKEGWSRSQKNDLDTLTADIQNEADVIFQNLQVKLRRMAPEDILVKPWVERLKEMVAAEKDRLKALEQEATRTYEAEIDVATWQCSEDYHGYDSELQRILVRCLDERCRSLTQARELKLALCRWRLDYQKMFTRDVSTTKRDYVHRRSSNTWMNEAKETGPRRFMMVRRLLRRLWTHGKVPYSEMHDFLRRVTDCACKHGCGKDVFLPLYRKEIEKYGALPLVAQARNPEVLDLWMQALVLHKKKPNQEAQNDKPKDDSKKQSPKKGDSANAFSFVANTMGSGQK